MPEFKCRSCGRKLVRIAYNLAGNKIRNEWICPQKDAGGHAPPDFKCTVCGTGMIGQGDREDLNDDYVEYCPNVQCPAKTA